MPTFHSIVSATDGLRRESDFVTEVVSWRLTCKKCRLVNMTWLVSWFSH